MLKINETRYRFVISSPAGPVGRDLARKGVRMQNVARALITHEKLVRTGRYRSSIAWKVIAEGAGLLLKFGSPLEVAKLIEEGTGPHFIEPRRKQALWWTHGEERGWFVPSYPLPIVRHPGTRPYLILHRAVFAVLKGGLG